MLGRLKNIFFKSNKVKFGEGYEIHGGATVITDNEKYKAVIESEFSNLNEQNRSAYDNEIREAVESSCCFSQFVSKRDSINDKYRRDKGWER